jgi:hypothetical protein
MCSDRDLICFELSDWFSAQPAASGMRGRLVMDAPRARRVESWS